MTPVESLYDIPKGLFQYRGRAGRREFFWKTMVWIPMITVAVVFLLSFLLIPLVGPNLTFSVGILLTVVILLAVTIPVTMRRSRDAGLPEWFYPGLLLLIIAIGVMRIDRIGAALSLVNSVALLLMPTAQRENAEDRL